MSMLTSFFRTAAPAFGLFALLALPSPNLTSAEGDSVVKTHSAMENCPVCKKSMKDATDKKSMTVDGRAMHVCGEKCATEVTANKEYYKGYYDGTNDVHKSHIGPKGGDTRKGVPTGQ